MAIHNWVRCHWRNGRHDLHDVPDEWRAQLEVHLSKNRAGAKQLGVVRVASLDAVELAWVECEVPLTSIGRGLTYRRARAIHALIRPTAAGGAFTLHEVESLLTQRYGEPVERGLAAQHGTLMELHHPEDAASAMGLFVGRAEALPSEIDRDLRRPFVVASPDDVAEADDPRVDDLGQDEAPTLTQWVKRLSLIDPTRAGAEPLSSEPLALRVIGEKIRHADELETDRDVAHEVPVDDEDEDAVLEEAPALFDLSRPRDDRPVAPQSSLSGLLGPSHTAQI